MELHLIAEQGHADGDRIREQPGGELLRPMSLVLPCRRSASSAWSVSAIGTSGLGPMEEDQVDPIETQAIEALIHRRAIRSAFKSSARSSFAMKISSRGSAALRIPRRRRPRCGSPVPCQSPDTRPRSPRRRAVWHSLPFNGHVPKPIAGIGPSIKSGMVPPPPEMFHRSRSLRQEFLQGGFGALLVLRTRGARYA